MALTCQILAPVLMVLGLVACVIPVIPGPLTAYCGLLCLLLTPDVPPTGVWVAFGVVVALVSLLDFVMPIVGAKWFKCSKTGIWGCTLGGIVGLFFMPFGLILGPYIGSVIGELAAQKTLKEALVGGIGAVLGFLSSVVMKALYCCSLIAYYAYHLYV